MEFLKDMVSGFIGGVCCTFAGLPLDLVKVRQQTIFKDKTLSAAFLATVRKEGVFALWKGSTPALASVLTENAVVFAANGVIKRIVLENQPNKTLSFYQEAYVGGLSAIFSATAICPAEVVKVRMQVSIKDQNRRKPSFFKTIQNLYSEGGVRLFFRGLPSILSRDIPFYVLFFTSYEMYMSTLKSYINRPTIDAMVGHDDENISPVHYVMGGGFAGMIAWSFVFPFDVIKSRQQSSVKQASFSHIAKDILFREGLRQSMKGWTAAVLRGFPANGALFLGVEVSKKLMD